MIEDDRFTQKDKLLLRSFDSFSRRHRVNRVFVIQGFAGAFLQFQFI